MTLVRWWHVGVVVLGLSAHLSAQAQPSALHRFAGTWKEDRTRRAVPARTRPPLRFQVDSLGRWQEISGPEASGAAQPMVMATTLDILVDDTATVWKQIDPRTFEQVRSDQRGVARTRRLTIDATGNILREAISDRMTEGPPLTTTTVYRRSAGGQGLLGRWQSISVETPPADVRIELVGPGTLRISRNGAPPYELAVDGAPHQVRGPALHVTTRSARVLSDGSLEEVDFIDGRESSRSVSVVGADGLTMTTTLTSELYSPTGRAVFVLRKQPQ